MNRKTLAAAFCLLCLALTAARAQTGSPKTQAQLNNEINTTFPDNTSGAITPFGTRQFNLDMVATLFNYTGQRVSVLDFGGVADSSGSYNSTNALLNAAALTTGLATGKCVYFPFNSNGYSLAANSVTVGTGQCVLGENQVLIKSQPTSGQWVLHLNPFETTAAPGIVQNLKFDTSGAVSGSTVLRFATASGVVAGVQISQVLCVNAYECIGDEAHASNYVTDVKMYDIRAELTLGRQIFIRRSRGFMWIDTIRIDQTLAGQTTPVTWSSARFEDFIGLELNRYDSLGPVTTTYQSSVNGLEVVGVGANGASVWLNRVLVDNTSGNGVSLTNINYLNANWIEAFGNLGNGITLTTVGFSEITNAFSVGGVGLTGAAAGANGFRCTACSNLNVSNLLSSNNTGSGLSIDGASSAVTINGYQATGNTLFATVLGNTANGILINGGSWTSNGGLLSNGSTGGNIVIRYVNGYPWRTTVADANYTALPSDDDVAYTSIGAARTVTLPAASLYPNGRILWIRDVSGSASSTNTISAAPNGTDTINGSNTTQVMVRNARGSVGLQSNGVGAWTFAVEGVNAGGTGLSSGTSGGVPYYNSTTTMASSGALTANGVVLGGGAGAAPTSTAAGTTGQVLTGVTGSPPTYQSLRQNIPLSGNAGFAGGSTGFMVYAGGGVEGVVSASVAMNGTFRNMRGAVNVAPGGADTVVFTLRVNGADTGVTCTITGAATACSDTTNTATITAGQLWSVKTVYSATAAASVPKGAIEFDNP